MASRPTKRTSGSSRAARRTNVPSPVPKSTWTARNGAARSGSHQRSTRRSFLPSMTYMASFHSTSQEDVTSRDRRPGALGGREIGDDGGDTICVLGRREPRLEGPTGGNTREDRNEAGLDDAAGVEREARDEP